jgi:hypothetical protein
VGLFGDFCQTGAKRYHPGIVERIQGRQEQGTFAVAYKTNTQRTIAKFAAGKFQS